MRTRPSPRRGANAIEFALTLPFFLVLILGLMDYGWLFALQSGLDSAVALSCRQGAMTDPSLGDPVAVADSELASRSAMFCAGSCTNTVTDMQTGQYAPPNRTLRCSTVRTVTPMTGFAPYPATIGSISFYRLEWQE